MNTIVIVRRYVLLLLLPLALSSVFSASDPFSTDSGHVEILGLDEATAKSRALRLFGMPEASDYDVSSHAVTNLVRGGTLAVLSSGEADSTRSSYVIEIKGVPYKIEGTSETRDFQVYIDSGSGELQGILSTLPSFEEKVKAGRIVKRPSVAPVTAGLVLGAPWECIGPATVDPTASFMTAIQAVPGNAMKSDRIVAALYELNHPVFGHQTYWVIETYGGFVAMPSGPIHLEECQMNYLRTIVDETGKMVMAGT